MGARALARRMRAACVILAAGRSARMGWPKALTPIEGEPALARIVRACEDAGLPRPVVVLGAHHDEVRAALPALEARVLWALNPDPDAGRTGSLQVGLALAQADEALLWPVDHPLVRAATARALVDAEGEWVVPAHGDRGGHPIVLRGRALDAIRGAARDAPLRDALREAGLLATRVPVDDPGVLANLDTTEDLARLGQERGERTRRL